MNDTSPIPSRLRRGINNLFDFGEILGYLNANSSISIFARFNNPNILILLLRLIFAVRLQELLVLWISLPRLDVERQRDCTVKRIQSQSSIVVVHVDEKGFFVVEMKVGVQAIIHQFYVARVLLFQVISQLWFAPCGPNKVGTLCRAYFLFILASSVTIFAFFLLADEPLNFLTVPPGSTLNNLSDSGVIITFANIEFVVIAAGFRSYSLILSIEYFVNLLHQFNICSVQKVRLLDFLRVNRQGAVAARHSYIEEFQQLCKNLLLRFHLLFKQDHNYLVRFLNSLVDHMFAQVSEGHEY